MEKSKNDVVFLRGLKTVLRPPNKEKDLDLYYKWINDPEVRVFLKAFRPISLKAEGEWIDSLNSKPTSIVLTIETLDGQPIGVMAMDKIDWKDRRCVTGSFIGEKELWGQGYGRDAKMALLKYAFDTLNLHKVCSSAIDYNQRSVRYNQACGYRVEGRLKQQFFRNGKYCDEVLLAVFRKDWVKAYENYLASSER